MTKTTPKVQGKQLYLNDENSPVCQLGSPAWFLWLNAMPAFRYYSQRRMAVAPGYTRLLRPISLRKEKRHRGYLWYAYIRTHGQLYKRYVGKTETLTEDRLDEMAAVLNDIW